ncbi:MAG: UDP-N-acetylglucosamine diphosphorylase [Opitutae bacterium]|jgi:UDP-N-acetylglucosamine diphosphorylase / glucose-1-phosphate thymidylyltransferase / UDP-N-acetylgalactosamine diphosphorylase / glucosamine-1-phosphate N-acetyltransferase / galactosamine-1-phosphate N-acetyltransferase|nr:UDP-N-acetylglucosamine diphosphorylase [Opitutae bacterium]MBT5380286.1 UDP-N-acetylglucosamine diphosphorylase [Opitutae bacterium]MBT6957024.1 UDP-N-acetylglucosamine diphosphorylase [Opitutae bacterium]MBT7855273.1 UDP-N-acetylglucosamine diphosphorylase [Opitutae bacterium]
MKAGDLWEFPESLPFGNLFEETAAPWEWLPKVREALSAFIFPNRHQVNLPPGLIIKGDVFLSEGLQLPPFGVIEGPAYIGPECELRPGVFIRGNVIAGRGCVLGNSCEYKNCLLMDDVQTPHFNYVGDSILGNRTHLGAGVILSNLRLDQQYVIVKTPEGSICTGLKKLGGILGDGAEVGCNTTIQPGTILGRHAAVFPGIAYGGYLAEGMMATARHEVRLMQRPDQSNVGN